MDYPESSIFAWLERATKGHGGAMSFSPPASGPDFLK